MLLCDDSLERQPMSDQLQSRTSSPSGPIPGLRAPEADVPSWSFLTNHAHVLIAISRDPELRQRDIAYLVGITPGAVQRIIHELEQAGYLRTERVGRRNRYQIISEQHLRHPLESSHTVDELLTTLDP